MNWFLALLLKPFVAVLFFVAAWALSRLVWHWMPAGRIKTILFSPIPGHGKRRTG